MPDACTNQATRPGRDKTSRLLVPAMQHDSSADFTVFQRQAGTLKLQSVPQDGVKRASVG